MLAARLDEKINIIHRTTSFDQMRNQIESESYAYSAISATVTYNSGDLKYDTGDVHVNITYFTIRYINDLQYTDIIEYDNEKYEIIQKQKLGRKDGYKLKCKMIKND